MFWDGRYVFLGVKSSFGDFGDFNIRLEEFILGVVYKISRVDLLFNFLVGLFRNRYWFLFFFEFSLGFRDGW